MKADSGVSGRKLPTKGAAPDPMAVAAASSQVVSFASAGQFVPKLSNWPPRAVDRGTGVPSGAIRLRLRSASQVWLMKTVAVTFANRRP